MKTLKFAALLFVLGYLGTAFILNTLNPIEFAEGAKLAIVIFVAALIFIHLIIVKAVEFGKS